MKNKVWTFLKQGIQFLVLCWVISTAVDWWRKPEQPVDFARQPVTLLSGKTVTLNDLSKEQTAVVYFWGSWCGICTYTSPTVNRLYEAGIPVVSVALQSGSDDEVRAYLADKQFGFDTVNDSDGRLSASWKVAATPTIAVMKNGKMVHNTSGLSSYWGLRTRIWLSDLLY
ncbi:protein disulfide oxidoreductase [Neisseria weaveri]|uniref:Periplasmic thioredoxin n=1 Tax=Neisseria weaveri TaxID=28091 RepID=A0A448VNN7_9NEIS|nr:protein disulfide oxidoreductase [Neisseria weaveri]EGV36716.1 antioxidant, AhpC/TSA family [Neisseria weaveri LMG 5135]VEJ51284.1 periplasmic thioredoxin [Neisseria weaveri]